MIARCSGQNILELTPGGVNSTVFVKRFDFKRLRIHRLERFLQELVKLWRSDDRFECTPNVRRRLRVNASALIELPAETEVRRLADSGREFVERKRAGAGSQVHH